MVESLDKKFWKDFCLDDIFQITSTSSGIDKCRLINLEGDIPYITRTDKNNGYELYVGTQDSKYKVDRGNVITIGLDTQTVFYQQHEFYTGQNIQILKSPHLNKYTAMFLIPMIKILMQKFNWGGNGATLTRLKRSRILLPTINNEPDYEFMENYIKERAQKLKQKYKNKIIDCIKSFRQAPNMDVAWKNFKVKNIFPDIEKCKCNNVSVFKEGIIPYVGATNRNNGTIRYINAPDKFITKGNCIVFICDGQGSVGYSIYKAEDFVGSTTLKIGRNDYLNRYNSQFIISALNKNRDIYSYGYKRTETRLKNETIYLPVNKNGEPDYKFMEDYMKYLEQKKLLRYFEFINGSKKDICTLSSCDT